MNGESFSRPARLAAVVSGESEEVARRFFTEKRILVRLEKSFLPLADARDSFLLVVNLCLRFCSNVSVCVDPVSEGLIQSCNSLARQIHGRHARVETLQNVPCYGFDAIVNIGSEILADLPSVTINSGGWVARYATGNSGASELHWKSEKSNPLGALAAACCGAGAAFFFILGKPRSLFGEISLFAGEAGKPGALGPGPALPPSLLRLDAFLVGCGAVSNGWAYAVKRLPIIGKLEAIDRQSVRFENMGPYIAVGGEAVGRPKAVVLKEMLAPAIDVTPRSDQWEFFKIWLKHGLAVPPLVIAGLDNVGTRHSVQRLWPETMIDMGSQELQSQVIVKHSRGDGLCLLRALSMPPDEMPWAESLAGATGLDATIIADDPTGRITQAEIDAAPDNFKTELQNALGKPRCGHINRQSLELEGYKADFAPAVPFVTAFSGIVGAAETMKWLMGHRYTHSLHFQKSFESGRIRALEMKCGPSCECQLHTERTMPAESVQST